MSREYRIIDDTFPSVIINRRKKTQRRMGLVIVKMAMGEYEKGMKEIMRETGAGQNAVRSKLGPKHKWVKNKKIYVLEDWQKIDILKTVKAVTETKTFEIGKEKDKEKIINAVIACLHFKK